MGHISRYNTRTAVLDTTCRSATSVISASNMTRLDISAGTMLMHTAVLDTTCRSATSVISASNMTRFDTYQQVQCSCIQPFLTQPVVVQPVLLVQVIWPDGTHISRYNSNAALCFISAINMTRSDRYLQVQYWYSHPWHVPYLSWCNQCYWCN